MWNGTLATVLCTFPKEAHTPKIFTVFISIRARARAPCAFCRQDSTSFADRGLQLRKRRPYFGDHGSRFPRTNLGFRARESLQAWIRAFPTCYSSQLDDDMVEFFDVVEMMMWLTWWCDWHDDVIDMMMCGWNYDVWLTWWWECCPRQPSVTANFSDQFFFDYIRSDLFLAVGCRRPWHVTYKNAMWWYYLLLW